MEYSRIRLRLDGMMRCWYLVPSDATCIRDVCTDVLKFFNLEETCPNGISLYMGGIVLPPGLSIAVLNANDLIGVYQNDGNTAGFLSERPRAEPARSSSNESKKRKRRSISKSSGASSITDGVRHPKKVPKVQPGSGDDHANSKPTLQVPKSSWISFPFLIALLAMRLSCTDFQLLIDQYIVFKEGRLTRENFVDKINGVAGHSLVYKAMGILKKMAKLQDLPCSVELARAAALAYEIEDFRPCRRLQSIFGGDERRDARNSTIMPK